MSVSSTPPPVSETAIRAQHVVAHAIRRAKFRTGPRRVREMYADVTRRDLEIAYEVVTALSEAGLIGDAEPPREAGA